MARIATLLAALALALASTGAHALFVNFETTPGGGTPTDNAALGSSYGDATLNVTFGWDLDDDLDIDADARFEARNTVADPTDPLVSYITGNGSGGSGPEDADFSAGAVGGDWLLRGPRGSEVSGFAIGSDDFLIVYGGTTGTTSAAGQVWDLDASEEWTVTAFDSSDTMLGASIVISGGTPGCCAGPGDGTGDGDGRPSEFSFSGLGANIATIRISYTGSAGNPGFGFDNFNATGASSFVPEPGTLLLLVPALAALRARRRGRLPR